MFSQVPAIVAWEGSRRRADDGGWKARRWWCAIFVVIAIVAGVGRCMRMDRGVFPSLNWREACTCGGLQVAPDEVWASREVKPQFMVDASELRVFRLGILRLFGVVGSVMAMISLSVGSGMETTFITSRGTFARIASRSCCSKTLHW